MGEVGDLAPQTRTMFIRILVTENGLIANKDGCSVELATELRADVASPEWVSKGYRHLNRTESISFTSKGYASQNS